ncbi:MAG TPA: sulfite exporter TauE/SafE family protein [Bacteroidales bacterium]|nr:sulfite exporter TauE/SafE family protein [Bacteroidales bacterium]
MTASEIITLVLIGLTAGVISGLMGVGGAIIMIPALVFFLGLSQHEAQGTSLLVLLFPVGLFAVINYYRQGYVNFKLGIIIILAFFAGSYFGSLLALRLPERPLKIMFGLLIIFLGARMIWKTIRA